MALEKIEVTDRIEVIDNGCVQVRVKTAILEDGVEIAGTFERHIIAPGDDYSGESQRVQAVCQGVHVPETIAAYQAMLAQAEQVV